MKIFSLIFTGYITEDYTFQAIFRFPDILLEFLNGVFQDNFPKIGKLTAVRVPGREQSPPVYSKSQYHIFHDVLARDAKGNAYVIEMERACQLYDVVRFQYTIPRAFVNVIDERFNKLRKEAKETAEAEVKAKEAAKAKPKAKNFAEDLLKEKGSDAKIVNIPRSEFLSPDSRVNVKIFTLTRVLHPTAQF
jgi:hypothetical protein